jgi:hypothetical protein
MPPQERPISYDLASRASVIARIGELDRLAMAAHVAREDARVGVTSAAENVRHAEHRTRTHPVNADLGPVSALIAAHRQAQFAHSEATERLARADRSVAAVEAERSELLRLLTVLQKESA